MDIALHSLILMLACAGCIALRENGSFTNTTSRLLLGSLIHTTAIVITICLYGTMRGAFVYTGLLSLFGMVFVFSLKTR